MTQQPYETVEPSTSTPYSHPVRVAGMALLAIFAIGIGNAVYSVRHRPVPVTTSALALQQQRALIDAQLARMYPPKLQAQVPDPNVFDESRDGSDSLSLEDENGKASVWEDEKSGSRIFCLDSCIVLPASKLSGALSTKTVPKN